MAIQTVKLTIEYPQGDKLVIMSNELSKTLLTDQNYKEMLTEHFAVLVNNIDGEALNYGNQDNTK